MASGTSKNKTRGSILSRGPQMQDVRLITRSEGRQAAKCNDESGPSATLESDSQERKDQCIPNLQHGQYQKKTTFSQHVDSHLPGNGNRSQHEGNKLQQRQGHAMGTRLSGNERKEILAENRSHLQDFGASPFQKIFNGPFSIVSNFCWNLFRASNSRQVTLRELQRQFTNLFDPLLLGIKDLCHNLYASQSNAAESEKKIDRLTLQVQAYNNEVQDLKQRIKRLLYYQQQQEETLEQEKRKNEHTQERFIDEQHRADDLEVELAELRSQMLQLQTPSNIAALKDQNDMMQSLKLLIPPERAIQLVRGSFKLGFGIQDLELALARFIHHLKFFVSTLAADQITALRSLDREVDTIDAQLSNVIQIQVGVHRLLCWFHAEFWEYPSDVLRVLSTLAAENGEQANQLVLALKAFELDQLYRALLKNEEELNKQAAHAHEGQRDKRLLKGERVSNTTAHYIDAKVHDKARELAELIGREIGDTLALVLEAARLRAMVGVAHPDLELFLTQDGSEDYQVHQLLEVPSACADATADPHHTEAGTEHVLEAATRLSTRPTDFDGGSSKVLGPTLEDAHAYGRTHAKDQDDNSHSATVIIAHVPSTFQKLPSTKVLAAAPGLRYASERSVLSKPQVVIVKRSLAIQALDSSRSQDLMDID